MHLESQKVDIIIPIYNAIDYVDKCVISILRHIPAHLVNKIYLYDDASSKENFTLLQKLQKDNVEIHGSNTNEGFGKTINKAFRLTKTEFVLVLNSDVEAHSNFLEPLLAAMQDSKLQAVNPVTKKTLKYANYKHHNGCVKSFALSGYAFLIRRKAFIEAGGFDPDFGKGYYEDNALARKLCLPAYFTGIVPTSVLLHHGSKSFKAGDIEILLQKNKKIFHSKFPSVSKRIFLFLQNERYADLSLSIQNKLEETCRKGGRVTLSSSVHENELPNTRFIQLKNGKLRLLSYLVRYIVRGKMRANVKITEIWVHKKCPVFYTACLRLLSNRYNLKLFIYDDQ